MWSILDADVSTAIREPATSEVDRAMPTIAKRDLLRFLTTETRAYLRKERAFTVCLLASW
jgi:hypothetical protein